MMPKPTSANGPSTAGSRPRDFARRHIPLDTQELPAEGEVHAWFMDLSELARPLRGALDGHVGVHDPAPFTTGQLRFARRFYLRLLLGAYLGLPGKAIRINRSVRGKPVLDATAHQQVLHFSLAKSEDRLLVGFSTSCHLGVDLEPTRRKAHHPLGVARRYFSPAESATLTGLPRAELNSAFLRTWACKEAVVKASGEGIANQLCRFTVETHPARAVRVLEFDGAPADDWSLSLLCPDNNFLGAVAAHAPGLKIFAFRLMTAADG